MEESRNLSEVSARRLDAEARRLSRSHRRTDLPARRSFAVKAALCHTLARQHSICNARGHVHKRFERYDDDGDHTWKHCCSLDVYGRAIDLRLPARQRSGSSASRRFGSDRFLFIDVVAPPSQEQKDDLDAAKRLDGFFRHGMWVARRHFQLAGFKAASSGSKSLGTAIMFAVSDEDAETPFNVSTVEGLWAWIGDFSATPLPSKALARIELAFSPTARSASIDAARIAMVDDVLSGEGGGLDGGGAAAAVMTDGCGEIAPSLLASLLGRGGASIFRGVRGEGAAAAPEWPTIVQVRVACRDGLFKGTLLATPSLDVNAISDPSAPLLRLRPSMRKLGGAARFGEDCAARGTAHDTDSAVFVDILSTGRPVQDGFLPREREREGGGEGAGGAKPKWARVWQSLVLLLWQSRGVPRSFIEDCAQREIDRIEEIWVDRNAAKEMLRAYSKDGGAPYSAAATAMRMLDTEWYGMDEPFITYELLRVRDLAIEPLRKKLKVTIPESCTFFGAPDPTGSLEEGTVFLLGSSAPICGGVIVARSPCLHAGEIRRLTAVTTPELLAWYEQLREACREHPRSSLGSVCLFSTRGARAEANTMGGDYDGDRYFVSWNTSLVAHVDAAGMVAPPSPKPSRGAALLFGDHDAAAPVPDADAIRDAVVRMMEPPRRDSCTTTGSLYKLWLRVADRGTPQRVRAVPATSRIPGPLRDRDEAAAALLENAMMQHSQAAREGKEEDRRSEAAPVTPQPPAKRGCSGVEESTLLRSLREAYISSLDAAKTGTRGVLSAAMRNQACEFALPMHMSAPFRTQRAPVSTKWSILSHMWMFMHECIVPLTAKRRAPLRFDDDLLVDGAADYLPQMNVLAERFHQRHEDARKDPCAGALGAAVAHFREEFSSAAKKSVEEEERAASALYQCCYTRGLGDMQCPWLLCGDVLDRIKQRSSSLPSTLLS